MAKFDVITKIGNYVLLFGVSFASMWFAVAAIICSNSNLDLVVPAITFVILIAISYFVSRKIKEFKINIAVIIIIVASVIAFLSVPSWCGSSALENVCIAGSGYICQNHMYKNGGVVVTLGQNTGTTWTSANFVFIPQGTPIKSGLPAISFTSYPANTLLASTGLKSGQTVLMYLPLNTTTEPSGTVDIGAIWVQYTIQGSPTPQYAQMAAIYLKAS